MARLIALEWDDVEARMALASARGSRLLLEQAFTVPLDTLPNSDSGTIGQAIRSACEARGIGRMRSLVALGRPNIELKHLSVPPAPEDELPEMVRFQALRDFNALGDDWPLDFVLLGDENESQHVLAAAISPSLVEEIRTIGHAAGLEPARLGLRPCAAASLLNRFRETEPDKLRLLVDLMVDEADLTVLQGENVVFLRTARLPSAGHGTEQMRALLAEIRRTLAAVQNRVRGQAVDRVYLCGDGWHQSGLAEQIREELNLSAELINPFAGIELGREVRGALPEHPGRFASLLGLLLDEADGVRPAFDFLNPRRTPEPPSRRRPLIAVAAVALILILMGAGWIWSGLRRMDKEIERLTKQSKDLDAVVKQASDIEKRVAEIDKWAISDVVWLDELKELSVRFPPAEDAMLTDLRIAANTIGGEMSLEGVVRNPSIITSVEEKLRDPSHRVEVRGGQEDDRIKRYGWRFKSSLVVDRRPPSPGPAPVAARKE